MFTLGPRFPASHLTVEQQGQLRPIWEDSPKDVRKALNTSTRILSRVGEGSMMRPDAFESLMDLAVDPSNLTHPSAMRYRAEDAVSRLASRSIGRDILRGSGEALVEQTRDPDWNTARSATCQLGRAMRWALSDVAGMSTEDRVFTGGLLERYLAGSRARGPEEVRMPYSRKLSTDDIGLCFSFLHEQAPALLGLKAPQGASVTLRDSPVGEQGAILTLNPGR